MVKKKVKEEAKPAPKLVTKSDVAKRYGVEQAQGAKVRWVHVTIVEK